MDEIYAKRSGKQYVSQAELREEYLNSLKLGRCSDKLLKYARRIISRFTSTLEYVNKCDLDACIEYALGEFFQKWDTFNPERTSNIFSFYTTMLANDLRMHYKLINKGKDICISIESLYSGNSDK